MGRHPTLNLIIVDVNKAENKELMKEYQVVGTPTFILFEGNNESALRIPGFINKGDFEKFVCMKLKDDECENRKAGVKK